MKRTTTLVVIYHAEGLIQAVYSNRPASIEVIVAEDDHKHKGECLANSLASKKLKLGVCVDAILRNELVASSVERLTTARARKIRFPGICEHARLLGVTREHLYRVLIGERPGVALMFRYRALLVQEGKKL